MRVLSGALLGGTLDYSVAPIGLWLRTERAIYRCLEAAPSYAPRCRPPGGSPSVPLPEASAIGLLHLFEHMGSGLEQPFQSKKRAAFPILRLRAYEVCGRDGASRFAPPPENTAEARSGTTP